MTEQSTFGLKMAVTAAIGALTALWGWFGWLVALWVLLMLIDFGTGVAAALRSGVWTSAAARNGIWHKAGCIAAVIVSGVFDIVIEIILREMPFLELPFAYSVLLCPIVLVWYILTEAGSIIENIGQMGAPMPEFLVKAIAALKQKSERVGTASVEEKEEPYVK